MRRVTLLSLATLMAGCAPALAQSGGQAPYADYLIGSYAQRSRDPVAAADRFAAALRTAPRDTRLLEGAADAALSAGDVTEAAAFGKRAQSAGVPTASGRLAMATLALRRDRPREVRQVLTNFDGSPVEQLCARLLESWAMAEEKHADAALAVIGDDAPAPRSPWTAMQFYVRAMILDEAGRAPEALVQYEAGDSVGGLRVAQVVQMHGALLERSGRKEDARKLYQDMLDDVDNPGVAAERARLERGEPPAHALSPQAGAAVSLFMLAVLVGEDPSGQENLSPLSLAMTLDPAFEGARIGFSDAMRARGRGDTARAALAAIPASSPYYETAQSQIAFSLHGDNRDAEAIDTLKACVAATGGRTSRRALADLYRSLERYGDAAPIYAELVTELSPLKPRDWRLLFAQGATLEQLGRWPDAEASLQQALRLAPDQPEVLNYLGYQWVDSGKKVEEGLAVLQRAVSQRPEEGYIIDSLGWAYYRLGQYAQAADLLERAVELAPGDVTLNDHLGDVYWRMGRRIEARYQWRRVLTLKPTDAERAAAAGKIAAGLPPAPAPAR